MLVSDVITRLESEISELEHRVQGAAELSELIRQKALPNATTSAYVLPAGIRPRDQGSASTGAFVQGYNELISIVLVLRSSGDVTGRQALSTVDGLVKKVIAAIAGWLPDDQVGPFVLSRGNLSGLVDGRIVYQLDFNIQDQIRNFS